MVHRLVITKARVNAGAGAKRAPRNGMPAAGIMDADEMEDYLELQDRRVNNQIQKSNEDIRAGRVRPATAVLAQRNKKK